MDTRVHIRAFMNRILLLLITLCFPLTVFGQGTPTISNVEVVGISDSMLSVDVRESLQKLVGQPNSPALTNPIAQRIESEHPDLVVATRTADDGPNRVRLTFVAASRISDGAAPGTNVNSQYTIESVDVKGLARNQYSDTLYDEMQMMVGELLDNMKVEDFRTRLRQEPLLKGKYSISDKIERGSQPQHVKLIFEAKKLPWALRVTLGGNIDFSGSKISLNDLKSTDVVNSAEVKGVRRSAYGDALNSDIQAMVGKRVDRLEVDHLKEMLEARLKSGYTVEEKFNRGATPNTVDIVYEVREIPWIPERTRPTVASYHPKQGISLFANGELFYGFTFGAGTDGDTLTERYKGYMGGYEKQVVGTRRFGVKIDFDGFGILWKRQTLDALEASPDIPGAYRSRQAIEPSVAFAFNRTLFATAGLSFTQLQMTLPTEHWESAHEATASLRYHSPTLKFGRGTYKFTAGYEIRTATRNLDSDFVYTRHLWDGKYENKTGNVRSKVSFMAGTMSGNAPLFERFSLGNTATLRGWNKYDLAALGGNRVGYGSLEYRFT